MRLAKDTAYMQGQISSSWARGSLSAPLATLDGSRRLREVVSGRMLLIFSFMAALLALTAGCSSDLANEEKDSEPELHEPPIVLISIDTLRADRLPAYGYPDVDTPALDALVEDSILFTRAYSCSPLTLPSHISLMTGLLPAEHGARSNLGFSWQPQAHASLPAALGEAGYATAAAVSAYVLRAGTGLGEVFDEYDDAIALRGLAAVGAMQRNGEQTVRAATRLASSMLDSEPQRPLFLFIHLFEPHSPYEPPQPYRDRYASAYDGEIAYSDEIVGRFLEWLRGAGLYDSSLIVVLSDHGEGLMDHGEDEHGIFLYREALHVPLIIKLPGGRSSGTTIEAPVQLIDMAHTIATLVGLPEAGGLPGRSLLGRSKNPGTSAGREIVAETIYPRIHLGWSELRSLIVEDYHYIEAPKPELYDLINDPGERVNLVDRMPELSGSLRAKLAPYVVAVEPVDPIDPDEAERLRQLGYLASGASADTAGQTELPDPKDRIAALVTLRQAAALVEQGSVEKALEAFDRVLAAEPGLTDAWLQKARLLQASGRFAEAAATYEHILEISPHIAGETATSLAVLYLRLNRLDEAARHARAATTSRPGAGHLLLGRIALAQRQLSEAEAEARRALEDSLYRAHASVLLAEILVQLGPDRYEEALDATDEANRLVRAGDLEPISRLAFIRGDALARLERFEEAELAFEEEISRFPGNLMAYSSLAVLRFMRGSRQDAEAALEALVSENPAPMSYLLAARTCNQIGDPDGAERWRRRLEEIQRQ